MYAIIDCSIHGEIAIAKSSADNSWIWKKRKTEESSALLKIFTELFSVSSGSVKEPLKGLKGIGVFFGAGGFTASRRAAVLANTLGFARHIRVAAVTEIVSVAAFAQLIETEPVGKYILPLYSGAPRIGPVKV